MGLIGRNLLREITRWRKSEEKLTAPPDTRTPKAPRRRSGARRTRKQIVARRKAMRGRRKNVQRLMKTRKP